MTINEIQKHPYFIQLSPQQRAFVLARCSGKETLEAAHSAWVCKTDRSAKAMAQRAVKNANVAWCLGSFFDAAVVFPIPTREEMASKIWARACLAKKDDDVAKLSALVADLLGYKTKAAENKPELEKKEDGGLLTLPG